jgi:glycosyltransferase involved in cell wall biosynthesis
VTSEPFVSIVTPVYNEAAHLAECIESVLGQTYQNWDYTIIDNCSTDHSVEIARQYAADDPRIRVVTNSHFLRVIPNHNAALREISPRSKYCKVIFGDDWMFPDCLKEMVAVGEEYPSIGLIAAYSLQNEQVMWTGLPHPSRFVSGREICRRLFLEGLYVFGSASTVLYRSDLVRSHSRFYNEANFHADSEACIELLKCADFGFVNQVLTFQRVRIASLSTFSSDVNTYIAGKLQELVLHGRDFLSASEYDACLERMLTRYYENLVGGMWRRRTEDYWNYHKKKLADAGLPFSHNRLIRVAVSKLLEAVLNPKRTIEKIVSVRKESKRISVPASSEESATA